MTLPQTTNLAKNPFFSVIICLYNRKNLVCRAIESFLRQSESSAELIIVDDGSTDEPLTIICKYLANRQISYFATEHHGVGAARNAGIDCARGDWITFLDSDDEYAPEHLASRRKIIESVQPDFVHGGFSVIGSEYVPDIYCPQRQIHLRECAVGGTFFISRKVLRELRFPDVQFADDALFYESVCARGFAVAEVHEPTYIYHRDTPDSLCNNYYQNQI